MLIFYKKRNKYLQIHTIIHKLIILDQRLLNIYYIFKYKMMEFMMNFLVDIKIN